MRCIAVTTLGKIKGLTCVRNWSDDKLAVLKLETDSGSWYLGIGDNGLSDRSGLFKLHQFEDLRDEGFWFHDICLLATLCPILEARTCWYDRYYNLIPGSEIRLVANEERAWEIVQHNSASFLLVDPLDHMIGLIDCWVNADGSVASEQDAIDAFSKLLPLVQVACNNSAKKGEEGFRYNKYADNMRHMLYMWLRERQLKLQPDESGLCDDKIVAGLE